MSAGPCHSLSFPSKVFCEVKDLFPSSRRPDALQMRNLITWVGSSIFKELLFQRASSQLVEFLRCRDQLPLNAAISVRACDASESKDLSLLMSINHRQCNFHEFDWTRNGFPRALMFFM